MNIGPGELLFGALIAGLIGVLIGNSRNQPAGTAFILGALLGPIGWLIVAAAKKQPDVAAAADAPRHVPAPAPAAPGAPAAWMPDPTGRFAHRYWDGGQWTEHVHNGTSQHVDPLQP